MRLCQILRAPDAEPGGGPAADEFVTISRADLDELRAMVGVGQPPADRVAGREEFTEALKSREAEFSREIAERERKSAELERAYKSALRDRELATALVGRPLVAGAATQLIKLWRDDFEVIDEAGGARVVARDGRDLEPAVADRLASSEFAHFCLPSSRGGTGTKGQNRSAGPAPPTAGPRTLGDVVLTQWREAASRPEDSTSPAGWGRRR